MKKLVKTILIVVLVLETLLIAGIISIEKDKVRQTHDVLVEKVKDFFVKATKRLEEFFNRDEETSEQIDNSVSHEDNTSMDSRVPQFMKASQISLKGGDK